MHDFKLKILIWNIWPKEWAIKILSVNKERDWGRRIVLEVHTSLGCLTRLTLKEKTEKLLDITIAYTVNNQ